jgi:hypothetical protein
MTATASLAPDERWRYQAQGLAIAGQYANVGVARGLDPASNVHQRQQPQPLLRAACRASIWPRAPQRLDVPPATVDHLHLHGDEWRQRRAGRHITLADDHCAPRLRHRRRQRQQRCSISDELWRYACAATVSADVTNTAVVTGTDALAQRRDGHRAGARRGAHAGDCAGTKTPLGGRRVYPGSYRHLHLRRLEPGRCCCSTAWRWPTTAARRSRYHRRATPTPDGVLAPGTRRGATAAVAVLAREHAQHRPPPRRPTLPATRVQATRHRLCARPASTTSPSS